MLLPILLSLLIFSSTTAVTSAFNVSTISFEDAYVPLFGEYNLVRSDDGRAVKLVLNRYSGSGFISADMYQYGLFSASIKLPSEYTAGVVVAFYTSNGDVFQKNHDELDFEFLGNIRGKPWRIQTNIYGNGSTNRGREERCYLPFDPTMEFHRYSIIWTTDEIFFYIDETPIRYVKRSAAMGGDYPSKPMAIYATIWDASNWATNGGKYRVDYNYAPFVSEFTDLAVIGCRSDPLQELPSTFELADQCSMADDEISNSALTILTPSKIRAMHAFREQYMVYSICYDTLRYPVPPPDCKIVDSERERFRENGHKKYRKQIKRRTRRSELLGNGGSKSLRKNGRTLKRGIQFDSILELTED